MGDENYYSILGCAPLSSTEQINVEFRRLAVIHHPDKCPGDSEAANRFAKLQEARDVLVNDIQRALYDNWLGCGLEVSFAEYKAMRERGGWHWREARPKGQLTSGQTPTSSTATTGTHSSSAEAASTTEPKRPHFSRGSSSRSELLRRFRNHEL